MNAYRFGFLLFVPAMMWGAAPNAAARVTYKMVEFKKQLPGCEQRPQTQCASVRLEYPAVQSAPESGKAEIDSALEDMLLTPIEKGTHPKDPEDFAAGILGHYQDWLKKGGDPKIKWLVEREISVQHSSPQVFCIRLAERVQQGKARAAKNTVYFNFRPEDGTLVQLSELIRPDKMNVFNEIAKRHFNDKDRKVPAGEDQRRPGEDFFLPKNFAMEEDGLRFRYEEDQVDPRSIRTPEFVVPYKEFRNLLQKGVTLP